MELQGLFHGCPHTLLTQSKPECKEMVLAKTKSSKVPCTVLELQSYPFDTIHEIIPAIPWIVSKGYLGVIQKLRGPIFVQF